MHDQPSQIELIEAVANFLERAAPELSGHTAFHARVAANVLQILKRDLAARPQNDAEAKRRLVALLAADASTPLDVLERRLAEGIRSGALSMATPGLTEHLKRTTIDQLNVDQPKYSGLKTALERSA